MIPIGLAMNSSRGCKVLSLAGLHAQTALRASTVAATQLALPNDERMADLVIPVEVWYVVSIAYYRSWASR